MTRQEASGPTPATGVLETARRLADEALFPRVVDTDGRPLVPVELLDELAAAGLYGALGPTAAGGLDLRPEDMLALVEILAGGCLATAFVWLQHHGSVRAVVARGGEIAERWLRPLCSGEVRAGVAFAGLRRPGPPLLTAAPSKGKDGYRFEGEAPWLTGWGLIDVALVAARDTSTPAGDIVWALLDALEGPGLEVERLPLAAMDATATVRARFSGYDVGAERVVAVEPFEEWRARDLAGLRTNGSMALGLTTRIASLVLDDGVRSALEHAVGTARAELDEAGVDGLAAARARAADLALEAAGALVVERGGAALLRPSLAEVLARQALFLLVFGQTRAIREAQLVSRSRPHETPQ